MITAIIGYSVTTYVLVLIVSCVSVYNVSFTATVAIGVSFDSCYITC